MIEDEFSGQGGTYLLDPETGKRTLLKRTLPPGAPQTDPIEPAEASPAPAAPAEHQGE